MNILKQRIEEVALNAWPAIEQKLFDGWILRYANGYTKRANSVVPLYSSSMELEKKIAYCENFYRVKKSDAVFKLNSFIDYYDVDEYLEKKEYEIVEPSIVLYRKIQKKEFCSQNTCQLDGIDEWIQSYCHVTGQASENREKHEAILNHVGGGLRLEIIKDNHDPISCGMGVLDEDFLGLFDICTDQQKRKKGHGKDICKSLMNWAVERGGKFVYLQVVRTNQVARRLYADLGFKELYRYWYRVKKFAQMAD